MDSDVVYLLRGSSLRPVRLISEGLYAPSKKCDSAVRNLGLAILLQALRDATHPETSNKKLALWRKDAMEWFFANDDYPGSFHWVCDILGMESGALRSWVQAQEGSDRTAREEMVARVAGLQIPH